MYPLLCGKLLSNLNEDFSTQLGNAVYSLSWIGMSSMYATKYFAIYLICDEICPDGVGNEVHSRVERMERVILRS